MVTFYLIVILNIIHVEHRDFCIFKSVTFLLIFRYNTESCQYIITWETRAACAVIPKEVVMTHGIIHGDNGATVNLSSIYVK